MTAEQLAELVKSMPESVAVLNGTGKSGVAGEISTRLQKIGVDVVHTGNAKHFDYRYSNIVYPSDAPASVKDTAKTLGEAAADTGWAREAGTAGFLRFARGGPRLRTVW